MKFCLRWTLRVQLVGFLLVTFIVAYLGNSFREKFSRDNLQVTFFEKNGALLFINEKGDKTLVANTRDSKEPFKKDILKQVVEISNLKTLCLMSTSVSDAELSNLLKSNSLQELVSLVLNDTNITDFGIEEIAKLPNLRFLHLKNTTISDKSIHVLCKLSNLEELSLGGTNISDEGLKQLKCSLCNTRIGINR